MRYALPVLVVCCLLTAGCVTGGPGGADASPTETTASSETPTPTEQTTDADNVPAINDSRAVTRALNAEEAYVASILRNASCVNEWGTDPTVLSREGTVENRSADGVYVAVQQPYWYGTDTTEADGASRATYRVTETDAKRLGGDDVSPC